MCKSGCKCEDCKVRKSGHCDNCEVRQEVLKRVSMEDFETRRVKELWNIK